MITSRFHVRRNPYRLELVIPGLPRMANTRQSRHWRSAHRESQGWQMTIRAMVGPRVRPAAPLERAKLTLIRHSAVEPDFDGLVHGFKPLIDSLRKVGVIAEDKSAVIGRPEYLWEKAPPGQGYVTVIVEALPETDLALAGLNDRGVG